MACPLPLVTALIWFLSPNIESKNNKTFELCNTSGEKFFSTNWADKKKKAAVNTKNKITKGSIYLNDMRND
jgi:hypothetical protein